MAKQVGLYEYLGRPVPAGPTDTTRFTASYETYDDQGVDGLCVPTFMQTDISRTDSETYDDQGLASLVLTDGGVLTDETRTDRETYDEDGALAYLGMAGSDLTTDLTHVQGETYDDSGNLGLGLPLS